MGQTYYKSRDQKCRDYINSQLMELPKFCDNYFQAMSLSRQPLTLYNYCRHIRTYLEWMQTNMEFCESKKLCEITMDDLGKISVDDANDFMQFIHSHQMDNPDETNSPATIRAYISSVSSLYTYFLKRGVLQLNPFSAVILPKNKKKIKIQLDEIDEQSFDDSVTMSHGLSNRMMQYRDKQGSASRDIAICMLIKDTGVRVSELVGLDIDDIDMTRCRFPVTRKGGNTEYVYFSDDVLPYLDDYMQNRNKFLTNKSEKALFLVTQGNYKGHRISTRSVERIVNKYATAAGVENSAKFSPHKLRHTCAMKTLKSTGNLALVQKKLGHSNIQSTTIYAEADDTDLKNARNVNMNNS